MQPIMGLGMNGLALVIYWLGAALVNAIPLSDPAGRLEMFSEVIVFSTYATFVIMSFTMLTMIFMLLPQAQVSAERINEVLDKRPSIVSGSVKECGEVGTVEFRNVSFKYPNAAENSLSNINFRIEKGQTLAIIGATGSGKSTMIGLIPRFYDATEGEVLVDGVNVKDLDLDALYDRIGYVTQKAVLFSGTVGDNIFFGQSAAKKDDENLAQAIEISQAKEFLDKTDDGAEHRISQLGRRSEAKAFDRESACEKTRDTHFRRLVLGARLRDGCKTARGA